MIAHQAGDAVGLCGLEVKQPPENCGALLSPVNQIPDTNQRQVIGQTGQHLVEQVRTAVDITHGAERPIRRNWGVKGGVSAAEPVEEFHHHKTLRSQHRNCKRPDRITAANPMDRPPCLKFLDAGAP